MPDRGAPRESRTPVRSAVAVGARPGGGAAERAFRVPLSPAAGFGP